MKLTVEQTNIASDILKTIKQQQVVRMGGFAGVGKTTVIRHLIQHLPNFAVCAYTGKAANILRKKGLDASTIHSLIYKPLTDTNGNIVLDDNGNPTFVLASEIDYEGIIIDEASMVNKEIYNDLISFGIPLIFVGDHGQLEPVGGSAINLMKEPDYRLETIHRNAGEIAHFGQFIRDGYRAAAWEHRGGKKVKFITRATAEKHLLDVDQVICAFNKVRVEYCRKIRMGLGLTGDQPVIGDRVMCLRNNREVGIFNGMQGVVKELNPRRNRMTFGSDGKRFDINYDKSQFYKVKYDFEIGRDEPNPFDFCGAITCHKAQGDEWNRGMVIEQHCDFWDPRRWNYTAATRFKEEVHWAAS